MAAVASSRANLGLLHDYSAQSLASEQLPTFDTNDQSATPILMPTDSPRRY